MVKKERNRYLLFKLICQDNLKVENAIILQIIWRAIWRYFGLKEASKVGLWLLEFSTDNKFGIIRISHNTKELIITAITLIKEINGKRVILSPIKTSGTINCIKRYLKKNPIKRSPPIKVIDGFKDGETE
jgi:ribonuclease P/MRP protein subunit POP5